MYHVTMPLNLRVMCDASRHQLCARLRQFNTNHLVQRCFILVVCTFNIFLSTICTKLNNSLGFGIWSHFASHIDTAEISRNLLYLMFEIHQTSISKFILGTWCPCSAFSKPALLMRFEGIKSINFFGSGVPLPPYCYLAWCLRASRNPKWWSSWTFTK